MMIASIWSVDGRLKIPFIPYPEKYSLILNEICFSQLIELFLGYMIYILYKGIN